MINNLPCRNNFVEGFHSTLHNSENSTNLRIWNLIGTPKIGEELVRAKMTQKLRIDSQRPLARYEKINVHLQRHVIAYDT